MRARRILSAAVAACFIPAPFQLAWAQTTPPAGAAAPQGPTTETIVIQGQFLSPAAESAMKLDIPVMDTPLSVTNYSTEFIKAIEAPEILDLYRYMTGVNRGGQSAYDLSLRGFKTTSNDRNALMTDGLPGQVSRFASPPTIGVDHIEVVKGPASVLYGQAQPGGFVNIILKKPQADRDGFIDLKATTYRGDKLSFGDANGWSGAGDFTGPLDDKGRYLYRAVFEVIDKDLWRDFTWNKSRYAAPSVSWNLAPATTLTFLSEYRYVEETQDLYLPAPNRDASLLPSRTIRLQEPDDFRKEEGHSFSFLARHEFAKDVVWNFNARYVRNHDYTKWYDPVAMLSDSRTLQRRARIGDNNRTSYYFDTTVSAPFETGPLKHKVLVGLTGGYDDLDANRIQFVNGATTGALARPGPGSLNIDIYNPVYGQAPRHESLPAGTHQHRITASHPFGAYLTDFITLSEQWKGSVGIRYNQEKQTFEELSSSVAILPSRSETPSDVYPMAGLLYQPSKEWTIYGSYSTSFVPIAPNMQDASGVFSFEPEKGKQFELGLKAELLKGKLYGTLALFDIKKENTLALITCNPGIAGTCMQSVGEETSRGAELELNLRPLRNWQVVLGYAYVRAEISKATTASAAPLEGSQLTNAPEHKAQFWSRYDVSSGWAKGLGIGFGLTYVSEQSGNLPTRANTRVLQLPAYTIGDVVLYYRWNKYDFTLKAGNIADKTYWDSVGSTTAELSVVPGAPRNITLSMRIPL
jgi:iron complex outermembrane recepter protein